MVSVLADMQNETESLFSRTCAEGLKFTSQGTHTPWMHYQLLWIKYSFKCLDIGRKHVLSVVHVSLEHEHRYICSNSQQYIVWVKIIHFSIMPKIIRY